MSKLRSINTAFWSDTWIEELEPNYKLLFLYLVTNDKTNMLGIYEASKRKISFETGLSLETVEKGLEAFERVNKVKYISNHIILVNYMKHQNYNTNMKKSAIDIYNNLPNELKIKELQVSKDKPLKGFESLLNHYGMVSKVEVEYELEEEIEDEVENGNYHNVDKLFDYYVKNNLLCNAVISNNQNKINDKEHLVKRLEKFVSSLKEKGRLSETWLEFTSYFINWNKKTININDTSKGVVYDASNF